MNSEQCKLKTYNIHNKEEVYVCLNLFLYVTKRCGVGCEVFTGDAKLSKAKPFLMKNG